MKNKFLPFIFLSCLLPYSLVSSVIDTFKKTTGSGLVSASEKLFVDIVQEKKNQLEKLMTERAAYMEVAKEKRRKIDEALEEVNNQIESLEKIINLTRGERNEFLNKKLVLKKELSQTFKDLQRTQEDYLSLQETFIAELTQFVNDPQFENFKKERHIEERMYYSFEDLQTFHDMIILQERLAAQLAEQEKNAQVEQESRKRMAKTAEDDHIKRVESLQNFAEQVSTTSQESTLSLEQQEKELLALEEPLFKYKKELYELRMQESKTILDLIQLRLFYEKAHLDLVRQHVRAVKSAIRVTEPDVSAAKEQLTEQKKAYFIRKQQYQNERDRIATELKMKERYRDLYSKEHNIPLGRDIDEWSREPKQTVPSYLDIAILGSLNAEVQWLLKQRDLLDAQRTLEDEKINYLNVQTNAKETYFKMFSRKFNVVEEITKEVKLSEMQKADEQATLAIYKERMSAVADLLNQQKKIQDNIVAWRERLTRQRDILFTNKMANYAKILESLNMAEEYVKRRIDVLGKLTGAYSGIISEVNATLRLLSFISNELQSTSIWYRPEYAITWTGLRNIPNDLKVFLSDLKSYIIRNDLPTLLARFKQLFQSLFLIFLFLLKIIFLCALLYVLARLFGIIMAKFTGKISSSDGLIGMIYVLLYAISAFWYRYAIIISLFIVLGFMFLFSMPDPYLYSIFCLCAIPCLLFILSRFMRFLVQCNMQYNYRLLSFDFQQRFVVVCSFLLYATVAIFLFRQSFMRISYYRTELPAILLAFNFIIFQISLILLITKDQILSILPKRNELWEWVHEQVDRYFYLILLFVIAIIVMSNPYVGFGRLVLYLLSSLILTLLLGKALFVLHGLVKKGASHVFFAVDDEMMRERFDHARTWFGLLIITSFFLFAFVGFVVSATIWGWQIGFKDVLALLSKPLLLESTAYPITLMSILQIIGFVMLGFFAAYAINRFVLDRIFDLLLVDPGVQYTTIRFIQYSVVIVFVFFGFKNVGLGDLVGYVLGALALGIGWYVREPIGDLVAYFIILVQRPLKIGDFIQIDQEIFGVVRKITPRAVVIRRRNSTTIVVPNSHIMNRAIVNWNYVRNFIAFNDILLVVAYKEDPAIVKDLLLTAVSQHPNVLRNPKPIIRLEDFGEFGYVFMVRGFVSSAYTLDMWDIASDVRILIAKILRDNNIEIIELMRIMREGVNRLTPLSPQQRESTDRKIRE
jgi:small-conductance mechanosensitive channel